MEGLVKLRLIVAWPPAASRNQLLALFALRTHGEAALIPHFNCVG